MFEFVERKFLLLQKRISCLFRELKNLKKDFLDLKEQVDNTETGGEEETPETGGTRFLFSSTPQTGGPYNMYFVFDEEMPEVNYEQEGDDENAIYQIYLELVLQDYSSEMEPSIRQGTRVITGQVWVSYGILIPDMNTNVYYISTYDSGTLPEDEFKIYITEGRKLVISTNAIGFQTYIVKHAAIVPRLDFIGTSVQATKGLSYVGHDFSDPPFSYEGEPVVAVIPELTP